MDPLKSITEEKIREACGDVIFDRACEYVCTPDLRKRTLWSKTREVRAEVVGNYGNYHAVFQPLKNGLIHTYCTCPAEMAFCKHAAALGITWIREPETFFDIESVSEILNKKSKKELVNLMLAIIVKHPDCLSLLGVEGFEEEEHYEDENEEWYDEDEWEE